MGISQFERDIELKDAKREARAVKLGRKAKSARDRKLGKKDSANLGMANPRRVIRSLQVTKALRPNQYKIVPPAPKASPIPRRLGSTPSPAGGTGKPSATRKAIEKSAYNRTMARIQRERKFGLAT